MYVGYRFANVASKQASKQTNKQTTQLQKLILEMVASLDGCVHLDAFTRTKRQLND